MVDEEIRIRQRASGILQRVSNLNQKYEANDFMGVRRGKYNYRIIEGRIPVMVSAPHTVRQLRAGEVKERDGMTGGIAEYLCERFGVWGVIRQWNAGDDPNYGNDVRSKAYREAVVEVVKKQKIAWVFDVHGCRNKYGFDMGVGINSGKNVACTVDEVETLVRYWRELGLDVRVDERFLANGPRVISNVVHDVTGVNCVQLELAERIRTTEYGLEKFCQGFEEILAKIV